MGRVIDFCNSVGIKLKRTYTDGGAICRFVFNSFSLTPDYICPEKALEDSDAMIYILKGWFNI